MAGRSNSQEDCRISSLSSHLDWILGFFSDSEVVKCKNYYLPPSRAKNAVSFTVRGTTSHLTNTA
jgi:hypothetical protein